MRIQRSIIVLLCVLSLFWLTSANSLLAQSSTLADVSINYIEASANDDGTATVSAYVSVVNSDGQPLTDLTPANFSLLENGKSITVSAAAITQEPIALVLAIDSSGSMAQPAANGQLAIEVAKQAAVSFIGKLALEDKVAVFSFNDEINQLQDLDSDHNAAINAINQLTYKDFGATCLYDAAIEAVQKSTEVIQGRRVVILLTDGVDEKEGGPCSLHSFNDVVSEATRPTSKVPIFTVGFGQADERELARMAQFTGGRAQIANESINLEESFDNISQQLKNQYLVQYQTEKSGEHAVVVKAQVGDISKSDERLVFVPTLNQPAAPTATPLPPALFVTIMEANTDKPEKGNLEIVIAISEPDRVTQAELFVDDVSQEILKQLPMDKFVLRLDDFVPGKHILRIEVTDDTNQIAVDKREISISGPPAPTPVPSTPTPLPEPAAAYNLLAFILIGAACLLLLLVVIGGLIFWFRQRKAQPQPQPVYQARPTTAQSPSVAIFQTQDELVDAPLRQQDPFQTMDEMLVINAGLVMTESETMKGKAFKISKPVVTLGRDAGDAIHDFNITDKSISRRHAKIIFDGRNYHIYDTGSSNGTKVNGVLAGPEGVILQNHAEIQLGKQTKLRFMLGKSGVSDDPYRTMDEDLEEDDPFKTSDDL